LGIDPKYAYAQGDCAHILYETKKNLAGAAKSLEIFLAPSHPIRLKPSAEAGNSGRQPGARWGGRILPPRIAQPSSRPGGLVLEFFAGSGTTGDACLRPNRRFILIGDNRDALDVMARRFAGARGTAGSASTPAKSEGRSRAPPAPLLDAIWSDC